MEASVEYTIKALENMEIELIRHGRIMYDQQNRSGTKDESLLERAFHKRKEYEKQREYRFIFDKTDVENSTDSRYFKVNLEKAIYHTEEQLKEGAKLCVTDI